MLDIKKEDWKKRLAQDSNAVVLDVRTPEEWAEGVMPNSLKIDIYSPDFMAKVEELDKSKSYYIYCRSGGRSAQACMHMMDLGFKKIYNLEGGMLAWTGDKI